MADRSGHVLDVEALMARLCIRIAPNDHPTDPSKTPLRTQPGDVVEIREDGHVWRPGELNCGQYRFIDVPGPESEWAYLKDHVKSGEAFPEFPDTAEHMRRRRRVTLDISALRSGIWRTRTAATRNQITAIIVTRT